MLINAYCTLSLLPALEFPHVLVGKRDAFDPDLPGHLDGLMDYIFEDGREMSSLQYALMRHVQKVQNQLSLQVEPEAMKGFRTWLEAANGIAYMPDGSIQDPKGKRLFLPGANSEEGAALPSPKDAWSRKERTDAILRKDKISVPAHLPPSISEGEVRLRSPQEVAQRAMALFLVAMKAESCLAEDPIELEEMKRRRPLSFEYFSNEEQEFMEDPAPLEEVAIPMVWRYEALGTLLWALGLVEMPKADTVADAAILTGTLLDTPEEKFLDHAALRPASEILDALDLHYRLHWAVRQADLVGEDAPANLSQGIILERHYALNWLVRFENAPWDDVDTPT